MTIKDENLSGSILDNVKDELSFEMNRLAHLIKDYAPKDGGFQLNIPGLHLGRISHPNVNNVKSFYLPSLGIALQGITLVTIGHEIYQNDGTHMHIVPIAMPITLHTTEASPSKPYLGIRLDLNPERIASLIPKVYPHGLPETQKRNINYFTDIDINIVNAFSRLLQLLKNPKDAKLLVPLIIDEILIRLLCSPIGDHVAEIGLSNSESQQVTKEISWLRENFSQPIKIATLAELSNMSTSAFHRHFKLLTNMSPLQYQKALRLHEARHLMLSSQMDATTACHMVGYISDSQFSRDYSNFFGNPPKRDIEKTRRQTQILF
ncbi:MULTISPECIES: AraC family transcriptional regulator [unclassified Clostridium]|uniref:AraC family transcriptional regulator n=1 Tax=unclassified Clostridium TaxID=2614128 RepID=UPI00029764BC|nr:MULTISPECIES: AraC family transcriptional regulator [unclassified Clostridium]EKQ57725.1 MAG: transcriptional regulator (amidase domain and AraC-type DNA-binding HTH domain containing protein) [Clostridium sp. Maddingley MBC34-26]